MVTLSRRFASTPDLLRMLLRPFNSSRPIAFKWTPPPSSLSSRILLSEKFRRLTRVSLLCLSISLLLVRVSGIMLQNPGFILRITPLAPAALKVVLLFRSSRVEFLTSPEIFHSLLAAQSSLTRLKNAIIAMRSRARSESLSVLCWIQSLCPCLHSW